MESRPQRKQLPIKPARLSDPGEKLRILQMYAGIFPNNISEFANKVIRKYKVQKNTSR